MVQLYHVDITNIAIYRNCT